MNDVTLLVEGHIYATKERPDKTEGKKQETADSKKDWSSIVYIEKFLWKFHSKNVLRKFCNFFNMTFSKKLKYMWRHHLPPKRDEVSVEGDVVDDPAGEGDLADVDVLAAANRVLDPHHLESPVEKSGKSTEFVTDLN